MTHHCYLLLSSYYQSTQNSCTGLSTVAPQITCTIPACYSPLHENTSIQQSRNDRQLPLAEHVVHKYCLLSLSDHTLCFHNQLYYSYVCNKTHHSLVLSYTRQLTHSPTTMLPLLKHRKNYTESLTTERVL